MRHLALRDSAAVGGSHSWKRHNALACDPCRVVSLASTHLYSAASGETLALTPGMLVTAEIHQGRRTVLEYLFSPVRKVAQEAGRER